VEQEVVGEFTPTELGTERPKISIRNFWIEMGGFARTLENIAD
jgi:hypothetical protein